MWVFPYRYQAKESGALIEAPPGRFSRFRVTHQNRVIFGEIRLDRLKTVVFQCFKRFYQR